MKRALLIAILVFATLVSAETPDAVSSLQAIQRSCAQLLNSPANTAVLQGLPKLSKMIDDNDMKAALVATYAMGMFYACNDQAANKGVQYLQKTYPASPHISLFTGTQYQTECPKCRGSGTVDVPCPRCNGRGKCSGCNGTGRIKRIGGSYDTCTFCAGSGQCPACNGAGRQSSRCRHCGGTGTIMSKQLMKDAYLQLVQETKASASAQEQAIKEQAYAAEQTAKGLVEFEGKWMTPAEKQRESEARTASLKAQQAEAERKLAEERRKEAEAQAQLLVEKKKEEDRNAQTRAQWAKMRNSGKPPSKEQWWQKFKADDLCYRVGYHGQAGAGQKGFCTKEEFFRIMGKPDRTQKIGGQAIWYYSCSDGQIQMVLCAGNLEPEYGGNVICDSPDSVNEY